MKFLKKYDEVLLLLAVVFAGSTALSKVINGEFDVLDYIFITLMYYLYGMYFGSKGK